MNKRIINLLRIIALTSLLFGLILFSKEIIDYIHLPTTQDIDNQFGGLVDLFKYKESCYKNLFLYSLIAITGLSFWINRKLYWGLTQVLLITLLFVVIINLWFTSLLPIGTGVFLGILSLIIFIYLEIKMCSPSFLHTMGISKMVKWLFFVGGGLSCAIWFLLWYV